MKAFPVSRDIVLSVGIFVKGTSMSQNWYSTLKFSLRTLCEFICYALWPLSVQVGSLGYNVFILYEIVFCCRNNRCIISNKRVHIFYGYGAVDILEMSVCRNGYYSDAPKIRNVPSAPVFGAAR